MANNVNAPFGLRPTKAPGGATRVNAYTVSSASARIFEGDPVELSSGLVIKSTSTLPTAILGVAARDSGVIAAGGLTGFPVYDDPNGTFLAQVNNSASVVAATVFGTRCGLVQGSGDTNSGLSAVAVDSTLTSTSYPILILRAANRGDNASGAYLECEVKIASRLQV
jgi:hypothetical protein